MLASRTCVEKRVSLLVVGSQSDIVPLTVPAVWRIQASTIAELASPIEGLPGHHDALFWHNRHKDRKKDASSIETHPQYARQAVA